MSWPIDRCGALLGRLVAVGGLLLASWGHLVAQGGLNWVGLSAWDDSLEQVADPGELRGLRSRASAPGGDLANVRTTLWRLREAALRLDRGALSLAADNALLDMGRHQEAGLLRLALARTFVAFELGRGAPLAGGGVREGEAYVEAAWRYLREGLEREPTLESLRETIRRLLIVSGDRVMHDDERAAMRILLADQFPHPDVLLAAARYQRQVGHPDSAMYFLNRAALAEGDPALLALERAWTLMALGDSADAEDAYWRGVERMTPTGRELYRYDLEWFLDEDSLAVFDAVPLAGVADWLRSFWRGRDVDAVNPIGARLREQLRRRVYVLDNFRLPTPWRRTQFERVEMYGFDPPRPCSSPPPVDMYNLLGTQPTLAGDPRRRELLLDHRGVIYLRHGEPVERIGLAKVEESTLIARNESWLYLMRGFRRLLHFHGSMALGSHAATTLRASLPVDQDLYASRGLYMQGYADAAMALLPENRQQQVAECEGAVLEAVQQARQDVTLAISSDSDALPFSMPWPASLRIHHVGDPDAGTSRILLTYAAPTRLLKRVEARAGSDAFPIQLRIAGYDAATDRYVHIDTLQRLVLPAGYNGNWVGGWLEVKFPNGNWRVSATMSQAVEKGEAGGAQEIRRKVPIDPTAPLRVSDPVAGIARGVSWIAPDGSEFLLNPTMVWAPRQPMQLYYEVYGIPDGTPFQTSIQVLEESDGTTKVDIRTTAESSGPAMVMRRTLDLSRLQEGTYTVRIQITAEGRSVPTQLTFTVKG